MNTTPDKVYEEVDELRNEDLARVPKGIEYALENGILRVNAGLDGKVTAKATVYTTAPEEEVEYKYNHKGLRIQKRHKKRSGEETVTEYMLHGKLVAHEKIKKKKADGTEEVHELHFFYDRDSKPEVMVYDGEIYYYIKNQQGDIVEIVDADGSTVVEYGYDAWGKNIYTKGSKAEGVGKDNPFRYRGYVYDEETELYYLRSRYYDPEWGRFLNADSVLGSGGLLMNNLYGYCSNNPVMRSDSAGKFWLFDQIKDGWNKFAGYMQNCFREQAKANEVAAEGMLYAADQAQEGAKSLLTSAANGVKDWWNNTALPILNKVTNTAVSVVHQVGDFCKETFVAAGEMGSMFRVMDYNTAMNVGNWFGENWKVIVEGANLIYGGVVWGWNIIKKYAGKLGLGKLVKAGGKILKKVPYLGTILMIIDLLSLIYSAGDFFGWW